jgi:DNA-binding transcriptional MerR regulator
MRNESNGKGRPQPKSPLKKRGRPSDLVAWMPRREACQLLQASVSTLRAWEGKRFRVKWSRSTDGQPRAYYHRDDIERVRLEKLGPRQWEIERHVLEALAAKRTPNAILHDVTHVTLADIEKIRDHDARLSGACILEAGEVRELRQLLDVEMMTGPALVLHVRAVVERVERLAEKLASLRQSRRSEPPPKSQNGSS